MWPLLLALTFPALNDSLLNVSLTWTWPDTDIVGYPELLSGAVVYHRPDVLGSQWVTEPIFVGAPFWWTPEPRGKVRIGMPWSWFGREPTWFRLVVRDASGNLSGPSNEVLRVPPP